MSADERTPVEQARDAVLTHIAPATVVASLPSSLCPYCLAWTSEPCAMHRPVASAPSGPVGQR